MAKKRVIKKIEKIEKKEEIKKEIEVAKIEVKVFKLDRNIKCGGQYFKKWYEFTEDQANFEIFKQFI